MKKIITLTMVKNEADIIETFLRYTANYAYKMYIIDNGSSDGTLEILKALEGEGMPLVIREEAQVFYEQFFIENKYMQYINHTEEFDLFIPLDADEFLGSDGNFPDQIEQLDDRYVGIIPWRTYCLTKEFEGYDFLDFIRHYRIDPGKVSTKVIIPHTLMRENQLFMQMGHHDVEGINASKKKPLDNFYMAHFPVRSREQIRLKIYQGTLAQLMSEYHSVVAFQWRKLHKDLRDDRLDLMEYSATYAVMEDIGYTDIVLRERPLDVSWCRKSLTRQYDSLICNDVGKIIAYFAEQIVLRSILPCASENEKGILIYGTGGTALHLVEYAGSRFMSKVICFIDSDTKKEYERFYDKLVLAPDKIRFLEYDCIVIASNYYEEIYDILSSLKIDRRKIMTAQTFLTAQME